MVELGGIAVVVVVAVVVALAAEQLEGVGDLAARDARATVGVAAVGVGVAAVE